MHLKCRMNDSFEMKGLIFVNYQMNLFMYTGHVQVVSAE